jgi:hypothetical protein
VKESGHPQAEGIRNNFVSSEARGLYLSHCEEKGLGQSQSHILYEERDISTVIRMRGDKPPLPHMLSWHENG